jgi:hypothetical protein
MNPKLTGAKYNQVQKINSLRPTAQTTIFIQQHLKQTQRVNDNNNDKLKVAKTTSNKFIMQLSQTGTDKNPLQNRIPGITHILQFD